MIPKARPTCRQASPRGAGQDPTVAGHPLRTTHTSKQLSLRRALGACLALLVSGTTAWTDDWTTGVGGRSERNGLSSEVGPASPIVLWEAGRPAIVSQQSVAEGDLLVSSRIQSFTIPTGTWVVGQDLSTGTERWAVQLPYDFPGSSWRSRVSAIRDGQVYATRAGNTNLDYLYALDPADGSILWRSAGLISEGSTESAAFAADGDIIAGSEARLSRIERADGATVWDVARTCPTSSGCQATVFGDRVYIWEASGSGPIVTAFAIGTGARLYSSAAISPGIVQQVGLMCGPDGTIYAPRTQNNPATDYFVALTDTGTGFVEKWRVPMGFIPFASCGVGPDGSVYSYSRNDEIMRLDPATGAVLDLSDPITHDSTFSPRMAIDALGRVYLTNGGFDLGRLQVFSADLVEIWSAPVPRVNLGGPVLAEHGTLVVCGTGNVVRAYRTDSVDIAEATPEPNRELLAPNHPNPFQASTEIVYRVPVEGPVEIQILDVAGRRVTSLLNTSRQVAGTHRVVWDGRDSRGRTVRAGAYWYSLRTAGGVQSRRLTFLP